MVANSKLKVAVLGSSRGTALGLTLEEIKKNNLDVEVSLILSYIEDAYILERAKKNNIKSVFVDPKGVNKEEYEQRMLREIEAADVDYILLVGFFKVLTSNFVNRWKNKIINIHPSLLPEYGCIHGLDVHRAVLADKKDFSGCTLHIVTEKLDDGPIILQKKCSVTADDTPESLRDKVQKLEGEALVEVLNMLAEKSRN